MPIQSRPTIKKVRNRDRLEPRRPGAKKRPRTPYSTMYTLQIWTIWR